MPRLHFRTLGVVATIALGLLTACTTTVKRGDAEVEVRLDIEPTAKVGPTKVVVTLTDMSWRPLNGAAVRVAGSNADASGAVDATVAAGVGAGRYEIVGFPLDVAGNWTFTVRVDLAGGSWAEFDLPVDVAEAGTEEEAP